MPRGLKQSSDAELEQMSVHELKLELAFWNQKASQFTNAKIKKLVLKYVYKIEKVLQRKEAELMLPSEGVDLQQVAQ